MGQSVEVVVSELNSAAARLADAGQRLQDGLSGVDLEVGQLLGSGWKGGAASAFQTEWDKWHSGAGQVVRGLQTMSQLLTVAGKEYAKTDEQAAGAIGSTMQQPGAPSGPAAGGSPSPGGAGAGVGNATFQADGATASGQRGAADLAQQMNLAEPTSAPAAQFGQLAPTAAQAVQGAAGQSAQATGGLAQQAAALAQQIVQLAQQAGDEPDESEDEKPDDSAQSGNPTGSAAPVEPQKPEPEGARVLGSQPR
ncbi:WXG100 family type VII secretion target [Mycolicibacterium litorale]|uniref:WXG100 family type VII secretion target n=1 Tax=Mycolicibacterium litorale TaxID=758802 RepID=UPI003CF9769C